MAHDGYNYACIAISPRMVARRQIGPDGCSPSFLAAECHVTQERKVVEWSQSTFQSHQEETWV